MTRRRARLVGGGAGGSDGSLSDGEDDGGGMCGTPTILALGNVALSSSMLDESGKAACVG